MDRILLVLDRYKEQQKTVDIVSEAAHLATGKFPQPPIVYTQTRSVPTDMAELSERRVVAAYKEGPFADAYRLLRFQVMNRLQDQGWNVLGVTSPRRNEGKSLTAINLGISLAMDGTQSVLVVDADLRNPSIHSAFGLEGCKGLSDYLMDNVPVRELLVSPGIERFVVLPGGRPIPNSSEVLSSPKMLSLVKELKFRYPSRVVIFDLPSLQQTADLMVFCPSLDATILVVEEGRTTVQEVQRALGLLKEIGPVCGTVLNKAGRLGDTD